MVDLWPPIKLTPANNGQNDLIEEGLVMSIDVIKRKEQDALALIEAVSTFDGLRDFEVQQVGKKRGDNPTKQTYRHLPGSERRAFGQAVNESKGVVLKAIREKRIELTERQIDLELSDESFDPTRTDIQTSHGTLHPLTIVQEELEEIFSAMGFMVLDYPEIEDEFHNFEALNIPADHPARDMQDTFWLKNGSLLRTHTSPGQIRAMGEFKVPFRAVFPGKVFRYEAVDASHEHTFHQIEGLMVAEEVSVANLISVMKSSVERNFQKGCRGTAATRIFSVRRARLRTRYAMPNLRRTRLQSV